MLTIVIRIDLLPISACATYVRINLVHIYNGAKLGGATGAMASLVFWSQSIKKSQKVSKSKSHSLEWHQLFLPSFGANVYLFCKKQIILTNLHWMCFYL